MNYIFISPNFPPNYYLFITRLRRLGVKVLGIADTPYETLTPELRESLTEYYHVTSLEDYEQVLRAVGYFTKKYGKIDRIESHNEHWLDLEARLREDFNVFGPKPKDMGPIKRKSLMKEKFVKAGINVARGQLATNLEEAFEFARIVGYPIIAKPDVGVGATATYKITNVKELESFFSTKRPSSYFFEEYIQGKIVTFDGLTDSKGNVVFCTSHEYSQGVMEAVNNDDHIYYFNRRSIPKDIEATGIKIVNIFNIKERFFHIEFFRTTDDQRLIALEINLRPPGGFTIDMCNFQSEIDLFNEYSKIITNNEFTTDYNRLYYCCYAGRKKRICYEHSHEKIIDKYGNYILHHLNMPSLFVRAMGDYAYIFRTKEYDEMKQIAEFIQEKRK